MSQELGETREALAKATWQKAEAIANDKKTEVKPFYIVYVAKTDPSLQGAVVNGFVASGGIRESWRLIHERPPALLGQLVWYVDNANGMFNFIPELSCPPDVPLDTSMLSDRSEDQFTDVMQKGKSPKQNLRK